jgi:hypothetical protein
MGSADRASHVVEPRRTPGFSLLEVQISVLLAALAFSGLSLLLTMQAEQLRWAERGGSDIATYTGGTYSAGAVTQYGVMSIQSESLTTGTAISSLYFMTMDKVTVDALGSLTADVVRNSASSSDCGRQ